MNSYRKIAVVGAGFGGLALAIRLQSAGFNVTLFEARDKPGGRAYVYQDKGYTFDAGPTVITDPTALEELFTLSGRRLSDYVKLVPVHPFYRLQWQDGSRFDYSGEQGHLEAEIARLSPQDVEGYRHLHDYAKRAFLEGYIKLGTVPFLDFKSMLRAAPQLVKMQSWRSVYNQVSKFIQDERLRQAFSFHTLLVGGSPFSTSSIYTLIHALEREWGVHFPLGGTGALINGMAKLFTDLGGTLRLNTPVEQLITSGNRITDVRTAAGVESFDAAASNGDLVHTYEKLLAESGRGPKEARRLKSKRFSMSLFVIYFGVRKQYPDIAHHTVLFGPRYKELVSEIFKGRKLAEDFSLYLHNPCVTDPSLAPVGSSAFYVLSPVPHLGNSDIDWEQEGPRYRDRILDYLDQQHIPGLKENLETCRIFTPLDFQQQLNSHHGSAFSLEPVLWQSAWFRAHNRDDVLPNLYFVGAGTHPGAGIPGVVGSAKATARLILEDAGQGSMPHAA